jgi:hypothetical protein
MQNLPESREIFLGFFLREISEKISPAYFLGENPVIFFSVEKIAA